MHRIHFRRIEFAVQDARAGAHALYVARPDHGAVAEAVLVLECSLENVRNYFHVTVTVAREPGAWNDAVLVDDPQASEDHMRRVLVLPESEGVAAVQPSRPGLTSCHSIAKDNHKSLPTSPFGF